MELRIAEDMIEILDYVSRVKQGVDGGEWHYVLDKAGELARAAEHLKKAAEYEIDRKPRDPAARPKAIVATITSGARHYVAGRALYPVPVTAEQQERKAKLAAAVADILDGRPS
jgi:hypothetical protein